MNMPFKKIYVRSGALCKLLCCMNVWGGGIVGLALFTTRPHASSDDCPWHPPIFFFPPPNVLLASLRAYLTLPLQLFLFFQSPQPRTQMFLVLDSQAWQHQFQYHHEATQFHGTIQYSMLLKWYPRHDELFGCFRGNPCPS